MIIALTIFEVIIFNEVNKIKNKNHNEFIFNKKNMSTNVDFVKGMKYDFIYLQ